MTNPQSIIISTMFEKALYKTNDPFEYAEKKGYTVIQKKMLPEDKAFSYNYAKTGVKEIVINSIYTDASQRFLLTHELGHCLFEHSGKNNYKDNNLEREYQANLFTISFLCDLTEFNMDIAKMPNYVLETIIEKNIKLKESDKGK